MSWTGTQNNADAQCSTELLNEEKIYILIMLWLHQPYRSPLADSVLLYESGSDLTHSPIHPGRETWRSLFIYPSIHLSTNKLRISSQNPLQAARMSVSSTQNRQASLE